MFDVPVQAHDASKSVTRAVSLCKHSATTFVHLCCARLQEQHRSLLGSSAANAAAALAKRSNRRRSAHTTTMPTSKKMLAKARDIEKKLAALDGPVGLGLK